MNDIDQLGQWYCLFTQTQLALALALGNCLEQLYKPFYQSRVLQHPIVKGISLAIACTHLLGPVLTDLLLQEPLSFSGISVIDHGGLLSMVEQNMVTTKKLPIPCQKVQRAVKLIAK